MRAEEGYVYAMTNPDYPGAFKIGMTRRDPETRAKELSSDTGVRSPFTVYRSCFTPQAAGHERIAHKALAAYRDEPNKEFFSITQVMVDELFNSLSEAVRFSGWWTPLIHPAHRARSLDPLPVTAEDLRTSEAKELFRRAEDLELNEEGEAPLVVRKRGGNLHTNILIPEVLRTGKKKWHRRSLYTADHEYALELVRSELKMFALDLDETLTRGEGND